MNINRKIIFAGFLLICGGIVRSVNAKKKLTPVLVGGYIFVLLLSILDAFGGYFSEISGALALLACVVVILSPDIFPWNTIFDALNKKKDK